MKILIEKQSDKVIFAEDDLQFTPNGIKGNNWECSLFNDSNSEIVDVLTMPDVFVGNAFVFKNNEFTLADTDLLQLEIDRITELKNIKPFIDSPNAISMRQARLQLLSMNLLDVINAQISTLGQTAQIEWEYATEVKRDNPLVIELQTALSMSETEMDDFFRNAALL